MQTSSSSPVFPQFPIHEINAEQFPALRENDLHTGPVWVQGKPEALKILERLPSRGIAVVGSRAVQTRVERHVRSTILELQDQDFVILSGLAQGVDTVAHQAALDAGLPTIGVLAHGLQEIFPLANGPLALKILESGGLLFSQYPLGTKSEADSFLSRNRWIAALSEVTWVAQAAYRSGALNTARHARELGRKIYSTPGFPGDPTLAGNEKLFNRDEAIAIRDAFDFGRVWIELVSDLAHLRARRRTTKSRTLDRVRALTLQEGLPLLTALRKVADEGRRDFDHVLGEFERQLREDSAGRGVT